MNEDVFLFFVPFALVAIAAAIWRIRVWESNFNWDRFRVSSFVWIGCTALVFAGFINMSDSYLLLGIWILISLAFVIQLFRRPVPVTGFIRLIWLILMMLPVAGWILYFKRFPYLHGIDAEARRLGFID